VLETEQMKDKPGLIVFVKRNQDYDELKEHLRCVREIVRLSSVPDRDIVVQCFDLAIACVEDFDCSMLRIYPQENTRSGVDTGTYRISLGAERESSIEFPDDSEPQFYFNPLRETFEGELQE